MLMCIFFWGGGGGGGGVFIFLWWNFFFGVHFFFFFFLGGGGGAGTFFKIKTFPQYTPYVYTDIYQGLKIFGKQLYIYIDVSFDFFHRHL